MKKPEFLSVYRYAAIDRAGEFMLGERFESRPNALNAMRLALASTVVVYHAGQPTDYSGLSVAAEQLLSNVPVDAFFAISGFLICRSWVRCPDTRGFLSARVSRLWPGLVCCLVFTAFVVAPLFSDPPLVGQGMYVLGNAVSLGSAGLDGALTGYQLTGSSWNSSLWTLAPEALCYLLIAYLGVGARLRTPVVARIAAVCWLVSLTLTLAGVPDEVRALHALPRLGLMFTCGALLWLLRHRVPVNGVWATAALVLVTVGSLTPNYRLVAAPALAYLCLYLAVVLGRWRALLIRQDLSYGMYVYGWPVQQTLVLAGLVNTGDWISFALISLVATLPVAAASWVLVERPALRLRRRRLAGGGLPEPSPA